MSTPSPYRPGFATQPPLLAGRQHLLQLVETAVRTSGNRRQSFQVLYGPRGVGKTVLLDRYAAIAIEREQAAAAIERGHASGLWCVTRPAHPVTRSERSSNSSTTARG